MKKAYLFLQICLLVFGISIVTSCSGQSDSNTENKNDDSINKTKIEKIDEIVSLYAKYGGFNGSVLVANEGEVVYKKGFGLANMEWGIPNEVDTKFKIASVTKQFTAMLILQLVAEDKLDLHQPISKYLPDYPKENGDRITLHHLLTHSSGIPDGNNEEKVRRPEEMVNQFSNEPLLFTPGERFKYSNSGYTLLGYIVEKVSGKPYEEVLQDKIFTVLDMKNSGFHKHRPLIKNMSSGYNKWYGEYYDEDQSDESSAYAAGAIYSTVEDLFLWDQALYNETLLPQELLDLMFTKHIEDIGYGGHYGYGWELKEKPIGNSNKNIETIGHSGSIGGFCSLFTRIPSTNSSIIFLNNTSRAFLNAMTTAITGILYDQPYDFPIKPLAQFMSETIQKEGVEKGILFYKEHKDLDDYYVSEEELIIEGYRLLHAGNAIDAAEVFKLSTEIFPYKDNPYDSYAEALMELGKNEEAIKNYKKSLLLNPKNDNAKEMLKKLTGREIEKISLLITEDTWGKEIFTFPLRFAQEIKYEGFEEAHFPRGWTDEESPEFWSYAFVWNVDLVESLKAKELEKDLQIYFDGLMISVNKEEGKILPNTIADIKKMENLNGVSNFSGTVKIYDSFVTKAPLLLNVKIEKHENNEPQKSLIIFKFSPRTSDDAIWDVLDEIKPNYSIE